MENLSLGMSGENIIKLQTRLSEFGFYYDELTGNFDQSTEVAVRAFQDSEGLAADGVVGIITLHELGLLQFDVPD